MSDRKISVILSVYNEPIIQINKSINSVLKQTYSNLELLIVDDNPSRIDIVNHLNKITDPRVKIIYNSSNMGLVYSLNKALKQCNGYYIARMDADDISLNTRLEDEVKYIEEHDLDFVGTFATLIDENDAVIQEEMRMPVGSNKISRYIKYGNCLLHPSWLLKNEIYIKLNGYRNIYSCEDYDFVIRAIKLGYKLGNVPKTLIKYRIRNSSISNSNKIKQIIIRRFLSNELNKEYSEEEINNFINSYTYQKEYNCLKKYFKYKNDLKCHKKILQNAILMSINKNLYYDLFNKMYLKVRESGI